MILFQDKLKFYSDGFKKINDNPLHIQHDASVYAMRERRNDRKKGISGSC